MNKKEISEILKTGLRRLRQIHLYLFSLIVLLIGLTLYKAVIPSVFLALLIIPVFMAYGIYEERIHKKVNLLSQMPVIRKDPTFVIDLTGSVVVAKGPTQQLFEDKDVNSIHDIFGETNAARILESVAKDEQTNTDVLEYFSPVLDKWYTIQLKSSEDGAFLYVWLVDITRRKRLDADLSAIRRFSQDVANNIDEMTRKNDVHERLAKLMFQEGFSGFFIAKRTSNNDLAGVAFKKTGQGIVRSNPIVVDQLTPVAAFMSQKTGRPYYANKSQTMAQKEFEKTYPFDPGIKQFLGCDVISFINYHEGDTVIVGYNKAGGVNDYDCLLIETVANNARTVSSLMDMSIAKARIINDLKIAQETQRQLLPKRDPDVPGLDVSGMSQYCDRVGGDYYDYIHPVNFNENLFGMVVADVSGHGISAALIMTAVRALLQSRVGHNESLSKKLAILNHYLCQSTSESGTFVTMMALVIDIQNNSIHWSRAGHEPVIGYNPETDRFFELMGDGMVLGFDKNVNFEENKIENIPANTVLLLATDGIFEARNEKREMYGKDPVKKIIRDNAHLPARDIKNLLFSSVKTFISGSALDDDLTLVVAKFE